MTAALSRRDRARGALLGLAAGDALGTTIEFSPIGDPFKPRVTEIVGGGPFQLPAGGWTDDTSMALCLADSLIACGGFDARDQIERYVRWYRDGENSHTGTCFDIGNTTSSALSRFMRSGEPYAGSTDPHSAGNGSLMRLVPVAIAARSEQQAIEWAGESSRITHGAASCVDSCRFYGRLLWHALNGASREQLFDPALANGLDLGPDVAAVAAGSYRQKQPGRGGIRGSGYVVNSLEAALWAFANSTTFRDGAILAVNLGEDTDTTGAVFGQIAGAYYGIDGIPQSWRKTVLWADDILLRADQLAGA